MAELSEGGERTKMATRFDKFTIKAQEAMQATQDVAGRFGNQQLEPVHLLLALVEQPEGIVPAILTRLGVAPAAVAGEAEGLIESLPKVGGAVDHYLSPALKEVLDRASKETDQFKDEYVSTEHLLLALTKKPADSTGRLLAHLGVTHEAILKALVAVRGTQRVTDPNPEDKFQALERYARDLTELARRGKLDPVIGRDDEVRRVIQVLSRRTKNNPVLIDELHTLVGAGAAEGAIDASNMLKPALARGDLRCIGATTLNEYKKHVEKDAALERRFQPVYVGQPTVEDTIAILRGLKERYEVHHGVRIKDSAIVAAAVLSNRYIADRFLPDKAIDLIDEAASSLRIEIDSMPSEIDQIERRLTQLEIERQALRKEDDPNSRDRLKKLEKELAGLREKADQLKLRWKAEKETITRIRKLKSDIEQAKIDEQRATRDGDLNKAAEIHYGKLVTLEKQLAQANAELAEKQKTGRMLKEEVDEEDVARIVSRWTGIPLSKMLEGEVAKLVKMENRLRQRVVGQDEALRLVANAVRRSRAGLSDPNRPIGSFIFLGPTGVGKTELARALAEFLFDDERAMLRIDMSEYMEKHAVARLIGAPPGYVGYEEGGQLTEPVRCRPYSVILFDEIEKAHPDVFNVLLQILDDGRLTDGKGRTVDFRNTVLVMTSNVGSSAIFELANKDAERARKEAMEALRGSFRPEFINRIDEIVIFKPLGKEQLARIVGMLLKSVEKLLEERQITLELTPAAQELLLREGYDPAYGARPLRRTIQRLIQDPLALQILEGTVLPGDHVRVDRDGQKDAMCFVRAAAKQPVAAAGI